MPIALASAAPRAAARLPLSALPRPSYRELVATLHQLAACVGARQQGCQADLDELLELLPAHADPRCTGLYVFATALARRLAAPSEDAANLYLRQFEIPQIELFNLLGRHVPIAALATRLSNQAIARAIAGREHACLIDVGMGTGRQFAALLQELAAAGRLPRQLTVVGIEPAAPALDEAQAQLQTLAQTLGIPLRFLGYPCAAEALSDAQWQAIAAACVTRPVINASFALHHIADDAQGGDQRNAVLGRLRALRPLALVLSEPDVNHLERDFFTRFCNCFDHFSATFDLLDELPITQAQRDALKVGFFGREIMDILGAPDAQRSERHETSSAWARRLRASGFEPQLQLAPSMDSGHPAVRAARRGLAISLMAHSTPLVSLFVATPETSSTH